MKKLILIIAILIPGILFAQKTKTELKTEYDVIRNETTPGANTKVRIADAYQHGTDANQSLFYLTTSGTDTYTSTLLNLASYTGKWVTVRFVNGNTGASTLNINSLGAIPIKKNISDALESGDLVAGSVHNLFYDGTNFQVNLGSGGAGLVDGDYGDITVGGVGTTMTIDNSVVTGAKIASSAALAGSPTTTTQSANTNNTTIATTAYVDSKVSDIITNGVTTIAPSENIVFDELALKANLASPALTGTPTSPTQSSNDNSTKISSTAYTDAKVADAINNGTTTIAPSQNAVYDNLQLKDNRQSTHNIQTGNYTLVLADADTKNILMRSVSGQNLTVPPFSSVAFLEGTRLTVVADSTGGTTIVAGSGVTIETSSGLLTSPCQNCPMVLEKKNASNSWYLWNGSPSGTVSLTDVSGTLVVSNGGTGVDNTTQTYTPTLTNSANLTASTPRQLTYLRVGAAVTVSGQIDIDPTTTLTLTTLGLSLPIASNFTTAFQAGGAGASSTVADGAIAIFSDATNDRVTLQYVCTDVTNHTIAFSFTYQVL